jgi:hypothetical protein
MLHFIVPFKSRQVSRDWTRDSALCLATLKALLEQQHDAFTVTLACHQPPLGFDEVAVSEKMRLVAREDFWVPPDPTYVPGLNADRNRKIRAALVSLRGYGTGYAMPVDADDTVSNQLTRYVMQHVSTEADLLYADQGYLYDLASGTLFLKRNMHHRTGTSLIARWTSDELPSSAEDREAPCVFADYVHDQLVSRVRRAPQCTVQALRFPSVCYVVGTGLNMIGAGFGSGESSLKRRARVAGKALARFWQLRYPGETWRSEFGIHHFRQLAPAPSA